MRIIEAIILGIIQGLTEFIPISSSGHLILADNILGFSVGGLQFDVILHLGTLIALLIYFSKDIKELTVSSFKPGGSRLGWYILMATIPAVVIGLLLESLVETAFRSNLLVAINLGVVGILMVFIDRMKTVSSLVNLRLPQAFIIGLAQALAIVPGVSRSGITILAGRIQGFSNESSARFTFLLGIPVFVGANLKLLLDGGLEVVLKQPAIFICGLLAAALSGYLAIRFMLRFLNQHGLAVFGYYRIVVAIVIMGMLALK